MSTRDLSGMVRGAMTPTTEHVGESRIAIVCEVVDAGYMCSLCRGVGPLGVLVTTEGSRNFHIICVECVDRMAKARAS